MGDFEGGSSLRIDNASSRTLMDCLILEDRMISKLAAAPRYLMHKTNRIWKYASAYRGFTLGNLDAALTNI